jgi:hypothetical protein
MTTTASTESLRAGARRRGTRRRRRIDSASSTDGAAAPTLHLLRQPRRWVVRVQRPRLRTARRTAATATAVPVSRLSLSLSLSLSVCVPPGLCLLAARCLLTAISPAPASRQQDEPRRSSAWVAAGLLVAAADAIVRELQLHHVLLVAAISAAEGTVTVKLERAILPCAPLHLVFPDTSHKLCTSQSRA